MSFLSQTIFCPNGHALLCPLCHVIQIEMLNVDHFLVHLFLSFHHSIPEQHQLWRLSQLQQCPFLSLFCLSDVGIATDATPNYWAFYVQGSQSPFSL